MHTLLFNPRSKGAIERRLARANAMPPYLGPITLTEMHEVIEVALKSYRSDAEIGAASDVPRAPLDISKNP